MKAADLKVGDTVRLKGKRWPRSMKSTTQQITSAGFVNAFFRDNNGDLFVCADDLPGLEWEFVSRGPDAVDPDHYRFPGGIETRQISAHLTSLGGQALQCIARSTRLDGANKGDPITDLRKAIRLLEWEIERITRDRTTEFTGA